MQLSKNKEVLSQSILFFDLNFFINMIKEIFEYKKEVMHAFYNRSTIPDMSVYSDSPKHFNSYEYPVYSHYGYPDSGDDDNDLSDQSYDNGSKMEAGDSTLT